MRYVMVIDLARCLGCNACTVTCKQKNGTDQGVFWSRVLMQEVGSYPSARMSYLPILCMHCQEPACEQVCPTGATQKLENGIVIVDQQKCIGCRACMVACPYNARSIITMAQPYFPEKGMTPYENTMKPNHLMGTVEKCNFCLDRVEAGLEPACVQACPGQARVFGDLDDPNSEVSRLIASKAGYQLHPELGTDPSVYYLPG